METLVKIFTDMARLASYKNDKELLMVLRRAVGQLRHEYPDVAQAISSTISRTGGVGAARRFAEIGEVPRDVDSGLDLLIAEGVHGLHTPPVLSAEAMQPIVRFVEERKKFELLLKKGICPASTLALVGPPGTGKTSLARWIAADLQLPLFVLNIASVITSYLGQTGQNLSKALQRVKLEPSVLLLDEFDAVASLRTIDGDVGEMRRIVAVLLKEIEDWPPSGVVIAASNLPELIDGAFHRRFSRWVTIGLPEEKERSAILKMYLPPLDAGVRGVAAQVLASHSGADLRAFAERVRVREVLDGISLQAAVLGELADIGYSGPKDEKLIAEFIKLARSGSGKKPSFRDVAKVFGISHTTAMNLARRGTGDA